MGAAMGGGGSARGRSRRGRRSVGTVSEINVTPLVDVMLVLLVVFMVAAPMMTSGINVQLPKAAAKPVPQSNKPPVTVSIDDKGEVYLDKEQLTPDTLIEFLSKKLPLVAGQEPEKVLLRADARVDYGKVMLVMGRLNQAGYSKISLITEHDGKTQ